MIGEFLAVANSDSDTKFARSRADVYYLSNSPLGGPNKSLDFPADTGPGHAASCVMSGKEQTMHRNVGNRERNIRLAGGLVALGLGLFAPLGKPGKIAAISIGAAELFTGITKYSPVNQMLGIKRHRRGPIRQIGHGIGKIRAIV